MNGPRRTSRRDFLQGRAAAHALADVAEGVLPATENGWSKDDLSAETYVVRLSRRAMACRFEVYSNAGQYPAATEAGLAALDLVDQLEDQLSVYRVHSEISQINLRAGVGPVQVEPRLFDLLARAVEINQQTGGAYDITAGRLSRLWGFTQRAGKLPTELEIDRALQFVGSRHITLDASQHTVKFGAVGIEINLGSIGKGYALDRCAELLEAAHVGDFLLHGGNSSVLARGSRGTGRELGWAIGIRNPLRPEHRIGEIRLIDRALATSGSGSQFFLHEGRRFGHILDARTGWPAEGVLSATVVAPTAADADALSTALYVMGPDHAADFCRDRPELGAVLTCPGARAGAIEVHVWGLDEQEWTAV